MKKLLEKTIRNKMTVSMIAVLLLVGVSVPTATVKAVTVAELQAQINALIAQLQILQGQSSGSAFCGPYTRDLTIGSQGEDVRKLQIALNSSGFAVNTAGAVGSAGFETTYFGPLTKSALARYQAAHGILPSVGYFGPITRSNFNVKCSQAVDNDSGDDNQNTNDTLQGGAGSIDDADYVSGLNNEEVGEDQNDVEVAGLDIEADGSDIEITAVSLNFSQGTANDDFEDYAKNVSIWLDGKKYAEVDADEFEDDDNYDKTISLSRGAIIKEGDEGRLIVAVSGISNLDSADIGDTWTVEFESVRFRDAQNAIITDTTTGDINDGTGRTFSFESFATASDAELRISLADDNPESTIINVDDANDTDNVEVLRFEIEAEGDSDLRIRDLPITLTVTGATDVYHIVQSIYVEIDGEEFSENVNSSNGSGLSSAITFEDFDYTIDAGDTVEVVVTVDINDLDANFDEGDTLKAEFTSTNRGNADVEDESGEDLLSGDRSGTALGEIMGLYDVAPYVELVSINTSVSAGGSNSYDDTGTWTIKYKVTAIDGDIYVSDTATATTTDITSGDTVSSNQVVYLVDKSGTATTDDVTAVINFTKSGSNVTDTGVTNGVKITEGSTGTFTMTIQRSNDNLGDNGLFRAAIKGISWATTDTATQNIYTFNLEEFESSYISIN